MVSFWRKIFSPHTFQSKSDLMIEPVLTSVSLHRLCVNSYSIKDGLNLKR